MITKQKFQRLPFKKKGELVFKEGEYVAVRSYYNYKVQLYSLYGFFVEVWYHPENNAIDKVELLESEKALNLYLADIDLESLLKEK